MAYIISQAYYCYIRWKVQHPKSEVYCVGGQGGRLRSAGTIGIVLAYVTLAVVKHSVQTCSLANMFKGERDMETRTTAPVRLDDAK